MNKGAFLDRDDVLNVDPGYVIDPKDWVWMPGAIEAICRLNKLGYLVIVISNQSGVGRGLFTELQLQDLHSWVVADAASRGARIDAIYYCPHHPESGCECRKPKPGMLLQAMREHDVDPRQSFMIGDLPTDVAAAEAAGIRGFLFPKTNLEHFLDEWIFRNQS